MPGSRIWPSWFLARRQRCQCLKSRTRSCCCWILLIFFTCVCYVLCYTIIPDIKIISSIFFFAPSVWCPKNQTYDITTWFFKVCLEIQPMYIEPFLASSFLSLTISVIFNWPWQLCWRGICSNQLEKIQEVEEKMENSGGLPPKCRSDWYRRPRLATWLVPFVLNSSRCAKVVEWAYTTPGVCGWVMAAILGSGLVQRKIVWPSKIKPYQTCSV